MYTSKLPMTPPPLTASSAKRTKIRKCHHDNLVYCNDRIHRCAFFVDDIVVVDVVIVSINDDANDGADADDNAFTPHSHHYSIGKRKTFQIIWLHFYWSLPCSQLHLFSFHSN